jgi:hypothetical protein
MKITHRPRFGLLLTAILLPLSALAADDLVVADFEGADYGSWKATGEAFGPGPARGTLPGQMQVDGFKGNGLVNSFYQGDNTTVTIQVDRLPEDCTALSAMEQSDEIKGSENLYREPLRGQLRFSPKRGWNNDPNGMVFYKGEYHLFFQPILPC